MASLPPTILSFAAVGWEFALVGRTRMLCEAWGRAGRRPVFVETPSLRTALRRVRRGATEEDQRVRIARPWCAPPVRLWQRAGRRRVEGWSRRAARELRARLSELVDWRTAAALVITPSWLPWLDELPLTTIVYDCIDDLSVQTPRPELLSLYRAWEDELLARCRGAIATAESLADDLRARRPGLPVHVVRNGVDVERFREPMPRPGDLPSGKPIIGFVGALYGWIDFPLIAECARAMTDCDFVLVGPHDGRGRIELLAGIPNLHLLGRRDYADVPAYVQAFDVCWIPFDSSAVSQAANPVKLYEYLAVGKPVVSTIVADPASFDGQVEFAPRETIMQHLRDALAERIRSTPTSREAFARRNDWARRAAEIASIVAGLHAAPAAQPTGVGAPS